MGPGDRLINALTFRNSYSVGRFRIRYPFQKDAPKTFPPTLSTLTFKSLKDTFFTDTIKRPHSNILHISGPPITGRG